MRVLFIACLIAIVIAIAAAVVLNEFVQESSSVAFSTSAVRL
jgi:ABC-type phosphate transport system permease subunit